MHRLTLRSLLARLVIAAAGLVPFGISAAPLLTMDVNNPVRTVSAGDSLLFSGVITNRTGVTLESTDLFLSFVGYDPDVLLPDQVLGSVFFSLPNLTFSSTVGLFSLGIDTFAGAGTYGFQVLLQDAAGNLSDVTNITINVLAGSTGVPEPSSLALVMVAGFAVARLRSRKHAAGTPQCSGHFARCA